MNERPAPVPDDTAPTAVSIDVPAAAAPGPWSWWQRFGLRYLLIYWLLYSLPSPLTNLLQTISGGFRVLATWSGWSWLAGRPFSWPDKWATELGKTEVGWQKLTTWFDRHHYSPYEVIHQRTGSGDTAHDIQKLLVTLSVAAVLAGAWSLLQRGRGDHAHLGRWLHLGVRFQLAFTMWEYGFSKFYGGQFGELGLMRLTTEVGDLWPMNMVGTFMASSKPYELFGGAGEVIGGLLLFHPRTALLGAFVTIGVMTNVCALNWLCGVPVKLFSLHLLLFALLLLLPWRHRLWALFVSNRTAPPVDLTLPLPAPWRRPLHRFTWAWVLLTLLVTHVDGIAPKSWLKGYEKSALYGLWSVEQMLVDGKEVPVTDATRWKFFAIDRGTLAWVRELSGRQRYFDFAWDPTTGVAEVANRGDADKTTSPWTCEQGTKVMKVDAPLILHAEDRGKLVDGERRTLVLKGQWGGKLLELHTVEKHFRLETGFRLRQELPDFW